jgi:dTDP-4-amino-4,6-dideoxygalactose transaminase
VEDLTALQFKRRTDYILPGMTRRDSISLLANSALALTGVSRGNRSRSRFEAAWLDRFGASDAIAWPSGRSSLTALLKAVGVRTGDEVVATGYTCMAVAEGILASGATPVWVDIERRSLGMDPEKLALAITPNTRAVVIQHTFGVPAQTSELTNIAHHRGLKVIEDCCHALGSRDQNGDPLGAAGDTAFWSFEVSKTISSGWGGMAQDNTGEFASDLRSNQYDLGHIRRGSGTRRLAHAGLAGLVLAPSLVRKVGYLLPALTKLGIISNSSTYTAPDEGGQWPYGSAISDHHWAILGHQFNQLESIVDRRAAISNRYINTLQSHGIQFPRSWSRVGTSLIRFPLFALDPDRMADHFMERGIPVGRWFDDVISPLPDPPSSVNYLEGQCPVGEAVAVHMANLPNHQRMSDSDVDDACDALDSYLTSRSDEREFMASEFDNASAVSV